MAFVVDQERIVHCPASIDGGFAEIEAVGSAGGGGGGGGGGSTVGGGGGGGGGAGSAFLGQRPFAMPAALFAMSIPSWVLHAR